MTLNKRNGNRKSREQSLSRRTPQLGYYFIVTDTKETERNYIYGLRNSIPKELQGKLVIKVIKTKTKNLIQEALDKASLNPQFGETWIIFDRDQVQDFDEIIHQAEERGIKVGWTNPCIEVWFSAYFGKMPIYQDSVACCTGFGRTFEQVSGQKYVKSDCKIYDKLTHFGDETEAIELAQRKYEEHKNNCKDKPSEMNPCTTIHFLVNEVKSKIKL